MKLGIGSAGYGPVNHGLTPLVAHQLSVVSGAIRALFFVKECGVSTRDGKPAVIPTCAGGQRAARRRKPRKPRTLVAAEVA